MRRTKPEFIGLRAAAEIAAAICKGTVAAQLANDDGGEGPADPINWYANAIASMLRLYGRREGSTGREQIEISGITGGVCDGGRSFRFTSAFMQPYHGLEIRRDDFDKWLSRVAARYPALQGRADHNPPASIPRENRWDRDAFTHEVDQALKRRAAWAALDPQASQFVLPALPAHATPAPPKQKRKRKKRS